MGVDLSDQGKQQNSVPQSHHRQGELQDRALLFEQLFFQEQQIGLFLLFCAPAKSRDLSFNRGIGRMDRKLDDVVVFTGDLLFGPAALSQHITEDSDELSFEKRTAPAKVHLRL